LRAFSDAPNQHRGISEIRISYSATILQTPNALSRCRGVGTDAFRSFEGGFGLRGASEQKMQFSKPLQNSQILQWLACHRFGWTFLVAKISRKNPNFCNKFCKRKKS
jgi:hypothetical protein